MHTRIDLSLLFLASFVLGLIFAMTWSDKNLHSVRVQSNLSSQIFSLDKPAIYTIHSTKGTIDLEIKNARARFKYASCTNKLCVKHGWLNAIRPMTACIPNEISAQLVSDISSLKFDAVSF